MLLATGIYLGGLLFTAAILPMVQARRPSTKERAFALVLWPVTLAAIAMIGIRG